MVRNLAGDDRLWIGLNDIDSEGEFRWLDGDIVGNENLWRPGQPNNHNGNEDCAHLNLFRDTPDAANDFLCSRLSHGLCEKPISIQ